MNWAPFAHYCQLPIKCFWEGDLAEARLLAFWPLRLRTTGSSLRELEPFCLLTEGGQCPLTALVGLSVGETLSWAEMGLHAEQCPHGPQKGLTLAP